MADNVAQAFVDECYTGQGPLRDVMARISQLPAFSGLFGRNPLDHPWFVARTEIEGFALDACALFELVVSLPQRLFDGDLDRYCAALGIPEQRAALLRRCARGRPALLGRADAYRDGDSYRLLELNLGSELGGMNLAETNRALLDLPDFRNFARRHQLGYVDTAERLGERDPPASAGRGASRTRPARSRRGKNGAIHDVRERFVLEQGSTGSPNEFWE